MRSSSSGHAVLPARSASRIGQVLGAYALLLPAFAFIGVFVLWPVGYSLALSTMEWKLGYTQRAFVLLDNYVNLLGSRVFWNAALNTVIYTVTMVLASIALGLGLSLAIKATKRLQSLWQVLFFMPIAATMSAMAVVWRFLLDRDLGIVNALLSRIGLAPVAWLTGDGTAMGAVVVVGIWSNAGYAMVFFLAGLSNIPEALYEAASIDGAGGLRRFTSITWPLLSPSTLFVLVIMTVRALASFDIVKVLTDGGPLGATQVLSHLLYQEAFQFFDTGYASAVAVVFFVLVLLLALLQMKVEKWVHYQ